MISESRLKQLKAHVNGLKAVNVSSIKALVRELRWQGTQQINCRAQLLKRQHIEMKQRSGDLFYELMDFFDKYAQYTASYEVVGGDAPFGASHVSSSYTY